MRVLTNPLHDWGHVRPEFAGEPRRAAPAWSAKASCRSAACRSAAASRDRACKYEHSRRQILTCRAARLAAPAAELRQPLCLVLLRNCASPYEPALTAAVRLFEAVLSAQVGAWFEQRTQQGWL